MAPPEANLGCLVPELKMKTTQERVGLHEGLMSVYRWTGRWFQINLSLKAGARKKRAERARLKLPPTATT